MASRDNNDEEEGGDLLCKRAQVVSNSERQRIYATSQFLIRTQHQFISTIAIETSTSIYGTII